ncbi:hypothetical protein [Curtobacterium sp. Arg-1]|uniref:hypothetical protein n=1 Tax=Curtobacterium sp. Arg-1 TaxID=2935040 RepID=UPI0021D841A4|nr:hypothetical protein [Curtobacterium sp. Arg-1]UXZ57074.1 hypothetical protein MXD64_13850 [Curtobacterium sp. Arg-1]
MTDPVDTDALRGDGETMRRSADVLDAISDIGPQQRARAERIIAAADEVDRLRKELAKNDPSFWQEQSDTWKRLANDERAITDRLSAVIAAQQHDDLCAVWDLNGGTSDEGCTCWKADAPPDATPIRIDARMFKPCL